MKRLFSMLLFAALGLFGCQSQEDTISEQEAPTVVVTQWTDKMEVFLEYETAIVGQEIKFIIHLTTLADFQPVRDGRVILNFRLANGSDTSIDKDELLREGIFTPTITFQAAGNYKFSLQYQGSKASESFAIGTLTVYQSFEEVPAGEEEPVGEEITFLKEQQWKIDFATEEAQTRVIKSAVQAVGEIRPQPASYAEIVSPVEGIISIAAATQLVKPGQKVKKGQTLAVLVPPLAAQNSWAEIYLNYEQAKTEYERAKRLNEKNAISGREYEQAQRNYELHKAGFANYFDSEGSSMRFDSQNQQFQITAPLKGIVSDVTILPGQNVNRNQKLFSIVDPSTVWLRMDLFAVQAGKINDISGASINIPGNDKTVHLDKNSLTVISRGEMIDPKTHTIPLWLEVDNHNRQYMIGQTFNAQIYTSPDAEFLTVPVSAVYEDNTQKIVFVHTAGESFEKREIITGPDYYGFTAVKSGVKSGERVVIRGGYQVKLASTSEEIGHPHTH